VKFDTSEEQELLQATVAQFAEGECPPPRVRELFDAESGHEPELWRGLCDLGVAGLVVPEAHGGAGLQMIDLALVAETLGYHGMPGPFLGHALACVALVEGGSPDQQRRWLPRLASGELLGSVALAESGSRWQPDEWQLASGATLSGAKRFVPAGGHADLLVVGTAGGGLALVETRATGVSTKAYPGVDRARRMDDVGFASTPCEPLARGAEASKRLRDAGLLLLAADAFGSASRLVDMAVAYAKTREQFGVTIGHFQALKHQLANMAVELEPARGLWWYAAHAYDDVPADAERYAALAKAHVTERAMQAARDVVEAHGGIGFTWECDVQIWFKRCMLDRAWLGTPSVHRERVAKLSGW
jgi:alkylation response protein AidB-like acyl-CoA dehydrogenase